MVFITIRCLLTLIFLLVAGGASVRAAVEAVPPVGAVAISSNTISVEREGDPETVDVAIWPMMIRDIDIKSNTYLMRAYVTFVWKGAIDPTETVEFMNSVNTSNLRKVKGFPKPLVLPDGRNYQWILVEGAFFVPFDLRCFPLDQHDLSFTLEDGIYSSKKLFYRFNDRDSGIEPGLTIPGWSLGKWSGGNIVHRYHQDAASSIVGSEYSALKFRMQVSRPPNLFLLRMLFPALVILIFSWSALYLHPKLIASRLAITGSSLMVTFLFQMAYFSNLPGVGYPVLMDKVFAILYLLIITTLLLVIFIESREQKNLLDDHGTAIRLGKAAILLQGVVFALYVTLVILTKG